MASGAFLDQAARHSATEFPPGSFAPSWSENSLVFICEFHHGPPPPPAPWFLGEGAPDAEAVRVALPAQCTVHQLRLRLCVEAQELSCHPDPLGILDPEKYILLYTRGGDWYELYDDRQVVRTLDVSWSRDAVGFPTARLVATPPAPAVDSEERQRQQRTLAYLIGHDLDGKASSSDRLGELMFTRRKLALPRRQELRRRDDKAYATEPWTTSVPVPSDLRDGLNRKLPVTLHYLNRISFTVTVDCAATPCVLLKVFRKVMADRGSDSLDDLVLRVTGREEFLSEEFPLSDFLWVRHCLKTGQDLHLSVVPVDQLPEEAVRVVDWPLVDSFTGQSSSHDDICLEGRDLDDMFMISLWDCDRRFRVKLLGFDIPKLPAKHPQSVYVEASILYGNRVVSSVASAPKAFTDEVLWNEWLEFDVLLRDLCRGAKLGFTINASGSDTAPTRKDSKSQSSGDNRASEHQHKGQGKVVYFVNLLLIDHRSVLSQGPHTLHMWTYPELEVDAFTYQADKLCTAANPDIADSMAVSFLLDRYSFPVVLPSSMAAAAPGDNLPASSLALQRIAQPLCPSPPAISSSPDPGRLTGASCSPTVSPSSPCAPSVSSFTHFSSSSTASRTTSTASRTTSPASRTTSPASRTTSPASRTTSPASRTTSPASRTTSPASRTTSPASRTTSPASRTTSAAVGLSPSACLSRSSTVASSSRADSLPPSANPGPNLPPKRHSHFCNRGSSALTHIGSLFSTLSSSLTLMNTQASPSLALPAMPPLRRASDPSPLTSPSPVIATDKARLRRFREESVRYASNLPQFLRSVNWLSRGVVEEVHWLLAHWVPGELDLSVALELLSVDFTDETVRRLAVQRLESLSNGEVLTYLLQLVQTLKVEPYHDSFLARFLIRRAVRSKRIGHFFFWYVRSEVAGCSYFCQRMAVVLEAYLLGCGQAMLDGFTQQVQAAEALREVDNLVKTLYPKDLPPTASLKVQELLRDCNLPSDFLVPFDPRIRAGRILLDRCKVMASKKKPLWLEFCPMASPVSCSPVGIIFKQGDDLRQDMLVIQTLVVMDSIWQEKSLDLNLVPYGCISTGQNIGMIEIVRDAVTIAAVQRIQGGTTGAFKNDALFDWLKSKGPFQEIHFQTMERFLNSCAGYCVATYVMGIGDRHNDNIMITDQGNLFHIDFGHILGNTKHFLGVNRERVPFVLTPDFLYVMGKVKGRTSLNFQRFRDTCTEAYLSLRTHSRLLVTLFSLMLLTGIPELSAAEDMCYLRGALQEDRGEAEAREHFLQQISVCEQLGWTVQANWWIHMMVGIK